MNRTRGVYSTVGHYRRTAPPNAATPIQSSVMGHAGAAIQPALFMIVLVTTVPPSVTTLVLNCTVVGGGTGVDDAALPPLAYATDAPCAASCET